MTVDQAYALLPLDAEWTASFGLPGAGAKYAEYHRRPDGERWVVERRGHADSYEHAESWTCYRLGDR